MLFFCVSILYSFVCFFCSIFLQFTLCFRASATGESVYAVLQCRCDSARSEIEWCALESTYRIVGGGVSSHGGYDVAFVSDNNRFRW